MLRGEPDRRPVHGAVARGEHRVAHPPGLDEYHRVAGLHVGGGDGDAVHVAVGDPLVQPAPGDHRADELGERGGVEQAVRAAVARGAEDPADQGRQIAPAEEEDLLQPELPPAVGDGRLLPSGRAW